MKIFFLTSFAIAALLITAPTMFATPCSEPVFTNSVNIQGPDQYQTGLAFADFNNDGYLDAIFPNDHNATVSLSLGDGSGGFSATTDFTSTTIRGVGLRRTLITMEIWTLL
jgi:hypothetical protein